MDCAIRRLAVVGFVAVVAMAAVFMGTARPAFASTYTSASASAQAIGVEKLVVVGDSYSRANAKGIVAWPHTVAKKLGLSRSEYKVVSHGGYAFAKPKHRFISLIKKQKRDPSVSHVLIMGGVGNDYVTSCGKSISFYKKTVKLLKKKYPNAKIVHAVTSWRLNNVKYQKSIVKRIPVFRKNAKKLGVTYLKGCENIMKKHPQWFLPDKIHPDQKGHNEIAKLVVKKLRAYL